MVAQAGKSAPLLVLVTGCPGAGKTTLATCLAEELRLPVISRDRLRDGVWRPEDQWRPGGVPRRFNSEASAASFDAFYGALRFLLSREVSVVGEYTFRRGVSESELADLLPWSSPLFVHCETAHARERFLDRTLADPIYADIAPGENRADVLAALWDEVHPLTAKPPPFPEVPVLRVDTSDGYAPSVREVAAWAWSCWSSQRRTRGRIG